VAVSCESATGEGTGCLWRLAEALRCGGSAIGAPLDLAGEGGWTVAGGWEGSPGDAGYVVKGELQSWQGPPGV
jgi:hypothetical protein